MTDSIDPNISAPTPAQLTPGELLREARLAAELSPEDVATRLKLAPRQIIAIEEGDWDNLPERPFTRGFMINYARLLELDPNALGLEQNSPRERHELKATPASMGEIANIGEIKGRAPKWLVPSLLVLVLILGAAYYQFGLPSATTTADAATTPIPSSAQPTQSLPEPAATRADTPSMLLVPPTNAGVNPPVTTAPAPATATSATPPALLTVPAASHSSAPNTATNTTVAAPTVTQPVPTAEGYRIQITFKDKSWTEVRSNGNVIFSETAAPGVREVIGKPPLSFVVGNANKVEVQVNGKPYDMSPLTRNDVARFRIE